MLQLDLRGSGDLASGDSRLRVRLVDVRDQSTDPPRATLFDNRELVVPRHLDSGRSALVSGAHLRDAASGGFGRALC